MPTAGYAYALFYRSDVCDEEGDKPNGIASLLETLRERLPQNQYIVCSQVKNAHPRGSFIVRNTSFVMKFYTFLKFKVLVLNFSYDLVASHILAHE